jgi:hypothetical protein
MVTARKPRKAAPTAARKTPARTAAARDREMRRKIDKIIRRRASALRELN